MLITASQLAVFAARSREQFQRELLDHAGTFAPELSRIAGEANMTVTVRTAVDRAASYGFVSRGPVRLYLELMLTFGSEFDTDPLLPWVWPVLDDRSAEEIVRAVRLHGGMQDYLVRVAGPDGTAARDSLVRTRALRLEDFEGEDDVSDDRLLAMLRASDPNRWEVAGQAALESVIARARLVAQSCGLPGAGGIALLTGLLFGFGHGIADDPLYPWIGGTLRDPEIVDQQARVVRLHRKVNIYIDRMIAKMD